MKCAIVYLSMTGNTETIAMGVRDGILSVTGNCDMIKFRDASPYEFGKYDLIAFGTIVMGYKDPDVFGSFIKEESTPLPLPPTGPMANTSLPTLLRSWWSAR